MKWWKRATPPRRPQPDAAVRAIGILLVDSLGDRLQQRFLSVQNNLDRAYDDRQGATITDERWARKSEEWQLEYRHRDSCAQSVLSRRFATQRARWHFASGERSYYGRFQRSGWQRDPQRR